MLGFKYELKSKHFRMVWRLFPGIVLRAPSKKSCKMFRKMFLKLNVFRDCKFFFLLACWSHASKPGPNWLITSNRSGPSNLATVYYSHIRFHDSLSISHRATDPSRIDCSSYIQMGWMRSCQIAGSTYVDISVIPDQIWLRKSRNYEQALLWVSSCGLILMSISF